MKDIPEELMGDKKKEERVAWMIAQIPEEELAVRKAERESLMSLLDTIDLPTTSPKGGNDD